MALSVGTVTADITGDPKGFNRAIDGVRRKGASVAQSVQQSFRNVGRRMQSIGQQMTAGLTLPLVGAGTLAVKTAGDYESLRVAMDTLNGSAEEGARNFERLKEFSAETPFQLQDLASAQNMLQGFSLSADEAFESIRMIGDIAAVTGGSINDIGIAFGQAAAEGRLMTRDIRQLINQGVPAIQLLADTMDVASSEVLDLASEGEISFEILQQAFRDATEEGGIFANGMEKQANTIKGVFSTLRDNIDIALGEIGNSLAETFDIKGIMREMISSIQTGIQWFNNLSQETRQAAFTIAGLLGAAGPIIAAIGTLSLAIGAISAPIAGVVAAFAAGATAIVSNWDEVTSYFTSGGGSQMWEAIKQGASEIWEALSGLFDSLGGLISTFSSSWGDDVSGIVTKSVSIISEAVTKIIDSMSLIVNLIRGDWSAAWQNFKDVATSSMQDLDKQMFLSMSSMMQSATAMTNLLTGDFQTAFEQFKFAYGFDNAYSQFQEEQEKNAQAARDAMRALDETTGVLKAGNSVTDAATGYINSLGVGYGVLATQASTAAQAATDAGDAMSDATGGGGGEQEQAFSVTGVESAQSSLMGLRSTISTVSQDYMNGLSSMIAKGAEFSSVTDAALISMGERWQSFKDNVVNVSEQVKTMAIQQIQSAVLNFGEIIGKTLAGVQNTFATTFEKIVLIMLDFAKSLTRLAAGIGSLMLFIPGMQGVGAGVLAASAALQGVITGVESGIQKRKRNREERANMGTQNMGAMTNRTQAQGNKKAMTDAFDTALSRHTSRLGPNEVFVLAEQGRRGF